MKFIDFLNENTNSYKTKISIDKAKQLIKSHCKNIDLKRPLWRGMRDTDDSFILQGENGSRVSITDGNYHNVMIDHNIKSKSLNCYLLSCKISFFIFLMFWII